MHHNRKERRAIARKKREGKKLRQYKRNIHRVAVAKQGAENLKKLLPPVEEDHKCQNLAENAYFPDFDDDYDVGLFKFDEALPAASVVNPIQVPEIPMPQINPANLDLNELLVGNSEVKSVSKPKVEDPQQEILKEVLAVQEAVEDGVFRQCKEEDSAHELAAHDEAVIEQVRAKPLADMIPVMGEFMATKLKHFCDEVDLGHPTIQDLLRQAFSQDSEFNSTLREIMTLLSMDNGSSMKKVLGLLKDSFTKAKSMKEVRLAIYKPPTRSLRSQEARDAARSKKTVKDVGLKEWLEKAKHWNDHPSSLQQFTRLNDSHQETFAQNAKKAEKMDELFLVSLAGSFRKRNDIINNFLGEQYCGFTKIKMIDAAIILAKVHGATFKEEYKTISYPRKLFAKSPFWLEPDSTYKARSMAPDADPAKEHKVTVQACMMPDIFAFKPRAYPLHEFKVELPLHLSAIVQAVEDHPDMLSKALFDQFWVIVPGVGLAPEMHNYNDAQGKKQWLIRFGDQCELHPTADSAERSLDFKLVKAGSLHPVLLGEKDGKCYFVTYISCAEPIEEKEK